MGAVMDGGRMEEPDSASLLPTPCLACLFLCLERTTLLDKIYEVPTTHLADVPDKSPSHHPSAQ